VNPFPDFSGPNPESIPTQFRQYAIPSLRVPNPAVPEAVEQVVLKALSKYPDDRYESVAAFAAALEKASKDRP
jgi:serine/threonine-protein kinase